MTKQTAALLAFMSMANLACAQDKDCAVVAMHGKWGDPQHIGFFARRLSPACDHESIELPWSKRRNYDKPYPAALAEINRQVQAFRSHGYKRILLAGHSFGANAAMAYMVEYGDVEGIIALAPGHSPAPMYEFGISRNAVDRARELVAAGKNAETLAMEDLNQGRRQTIRMSAEALLSYFDPQGLGHMPASARRFRKAVPFLWVIGTKDPLYPSGPGWAFDLAPPHPASKYLVVESDHANTPDTAAEEVLTWIRHLP